MSVRWERGSPDLFVSSPFRAIKGVTENFDMEQLVSDAADLMRRLIMTRGTGKVWSRPGPSGRTGSFPGRVDSGDMYSAVAHAVSGDGRRGEFGWLDNQEPYFLYQEDGFRHWISGEHIPAMFALQDAGAAAQQVFLQRVMEAVKKRG